MDIENAWDKVAFSVRLKEVIGEVPVSRFAQKCGIAEGMLRKYLRAKSIPGADKLVCIAKVGGVNLLWMAMGDGPKIPQTDWDQITPSQLAVVLEFERFAQQHPDTGAEVLIQNFVDRYNDGKTGVGQVGGISRISRDELILWRDLAWERQVTKTSIDEEGLRTAIEIADELWTTTSSAGAMDSAKKAKLVGRLYQFNASTGGSIDRSKLLDLLRSVV